MPHRPGIGAIFGITSEDGVAAQKRLVLMDRSNMQVIERKTADATGGYVFTGLDPDSSDYLIFAVDDDGSPAKEAIIHDHIQPIPAYSGATWPGNWEKRALKDDPRAGFFGVLDGYGSPIPINGYVPSTRGPSITYGQASLTPGAPHLSATQISGSALAVGGVPCTLFGDANPLRVSLEWVFKRSSVNSGKVARLFIAQAGIGAASVRDPNDNANSQINGSLAAIEYNHGTGILTAYNCTSTDAPNSSWSSLRTIGTADLSAESDVVHVVLTVEYGNQSKIYVNGALKTTTSLSGQNSYIGQYSPTTTANNRNVAALALTGAVADDGDYRILGRFTTVLSGPMAAYDKILTGTDVLDRYNDLMIGTTPAETGYAKEVLLDHPVYYYRMKEASGAAGLMDWLTQNSTRRTMTIVFPGSLTYNRTSPVAGSSMIQFSGGAARSNYVTASGASIREFSFEFIYEPASSTPAAAEVLIRQTDESEAVYAGLSRTTGGMLQLLTRESGSTATVNFTTQITAGSRRHIVITLDKAAQQAKLYINGALVETVTTSATTLDQYIFISGLQQELMIGGIVNDAISSVTSPMAGYLSEVAFYSWKLPASRIAAHYAARTIV